MPRLTPENQLLMDDFVVYLEGIRALAPSTVRIYRQLISAAVNKHLAGIDDQAGLTIYYEHLRDTSPAQAHLFVSAWHNFSAYMLSERGVEVASLEEEHATLRESDVPREALFELHVALIKMPLSQLVDLRWGDAQRKSDGHFEIQSRDLRGRATTYYVNQKGVDALQALYKWAYRQAPPTALSRIIVAVPDTDVPMSRQSLARYLRLEKEHRQRVTPPPTGSTNVLPLFAPTAVAPPLEQPLPTPPTPMAPLDRDRRLELLAIQKKDVHSPEEFIYAEKVTPEGWTDEKKLTALNDWRTRFPINDDVDFVYTHTYAVSTNSGEEMLARWRCARWETGQTNDLGPPPAGIFARIIQLTPKPTRFDPGPQVEIVYDDALIKKLVEAVDEGRHALNNEKEREIYATYKKNEAANAKKNQSSSQAATAEGGTDSKVSTPAGAGAGAGEGAGG